MRPDDSELASLLNQFVTVRITNFKPVDLNLFKFDYDLTFAALMMSAEGNVYSRFGTQDARSLSDRMSIAGLKNAMRTVLAQNRKRPRFANEFETQMKRFTLAEIPAYAASRQASAECAHCHFANNFRFAQMRSEGRFSKEKLYQYPYPENIGVKLRVDENNMVEEVLPDSPAKRAGIQAGDSIVRANSTQVLTSADLQFALNPLPYTARVTLQIVRNNELQPAVTLELPSGWRKSDISWRPSQAGVPPQIGIWCEPLTDAQKQQRGIARDRLALKVSFLFPDERWAKTRGDLRMNDVILDADGLNLRTMNTRQFHSWFRMNHDVGQKVNLSVLRGSEKLEIEVPCLDTGEE